MRPVISARASACDWDTRPIRIQGQPCDERNRHPDIETADQRNQREEVNGDVDEDISQNKADIAQSKGSLHDLGCYPAGKFVLIKVHALIKHQPMKIPAQAHRKISTQYLMLEEILQRDQ